MAGETGRRYAFGSADVVVSADGAVAEVRHPTRGHSMLLEEGGLGPEATMHDPGRRWGKGFALIDGRDGPHGYRWDRPAALSWRPDGVDAAYVLGPLRLSVRRRFWARDWTESYELTNASTARVEVGTLAISTPWRDVYGSSRESLRRAVHAHVWTGGADAWVWAVPMDGSGPGLGLLLTSGALWSYSVESRDAFTSSNVRGHLYLQVTDHARAPHAMGGQPVLALVPTQTYRWSWRIAWHDSLADFRATQRPLLSADSLFEHPGGPPPQIHLGPDASRAEPAGPEPETGVRHIEAVDGERRSRIAILRHPPLREVVEARVRFILDHQRATHAGGSRAAAFVPYDNSTGLSVLAGGWPDWNAARERVGMARLLQVTLALGWADPDELTAALTAYQRFVLEHVVAEDGTVADHPGRPPRLYNFPWYARFLLEQGDLDRPVHILERYYALGGGRFLALDIGALLHDLITRLTEAGRTADAGRLHTHLLDHARTFIAYGEDLPAHEVNYEQSMVAPLLELLLAAHTLDPAAVPASELTARLPWLTAFAADQPDARLNHIPIRHWDGYWFGATRTWGDVFPHHWSVLSAAVYLSWPPHLATDPQLAELREAGRAILRANLANFSPDGRATCAFVYPSCVNNRPAHTADPMANDQDWALVYALTYDPPS